MVYDMLKEARKQEYINNMTRPELDFSKIKIGMKTVDDAVYMLGDIKKVDSRFGSKQEVLKAIANNDIKAMREISRFYYRTSGIYSRLCRYMAYMYRYDWIITPFVESESLKSEKILNGFNKAIRYLDNFDVRCFCKDAALKVVRDGCYYGYLIINGDKATIQELPPEYCRSRFKVGSAPVVEFNMKFFDDYFRDAEQKMKMLKLFPKEFAKGYIAYKEGKLKPDFSGDTSGWYTLDYKYTVKFNLGDTDYPPFIAVIPALIDLDVAQDLDRKKMQQQLLKIIIQQMPIDKNGDLVFDVDEAAELHNNAVKMLGRAIGIDVLTTFADVNVESLADNSTIKSSTESIDTANQTVFDQSGISYMQFNADNSVALEKSIANDEAMMLPLIHQFQDFINRILEPYNKNPKKILYVAEILPTTIYNYKELAKLYKEQTQLGYSKMLPQVALGQTQSTVLATAYFENDVLDLVNVFIPPMSSNTMNADALRQTTGKDQPMADKKGGRPTNESKGEVTTEKTIANKESKGNG